MFYSSEFKSNLGESFYVIKGNNLTLRSLKDLLDVCEGVVWAAASYLT